MTTHLKNYFSVGPFADNYTLMYEFSTSIYVNHLYQETIEELLNAEKELTVAVKKGLDDNEIEILKERVKFLESVVSLANKNYNQSETCVA